MPKLNLKGQGSIYVLLILGGVIAVSFLISDGILPKIKHSDKSDRVISKVFLPAADNPGNPNGLQLKNLEFDPGSVTIIPSPTPTSENQSDTTNPTPDSTPNPILIASAPSLTPTRNPTPSSAVSPAQTPSITTTTTPTRSTTVTPPTSTPRPSTTPTPGLAPLNNFQQNLLALARSQKGESYKMGACENWSSGSNRPGNPPIKSDACSKWDCSNWLAWVYYWATNGKITMKSQTCSDYGQCYAKYGGFTNYNSHDTRLYTKYTYNDQSKLQFGDIVYFGTRSNSLPEISHVGLYIGKYGNCGGDDCIIDSSASGGGVSERRLSKVSKSLVGFLRPKI